VDIVECLGMMENLFTLARHMRVDLELQKTLELGERFDESANDEEWI